MQTRWETAAVLGLALLLTACGGGGGGGGGSSNSGVSGSGSSSPSSSPSSVPSTGTSGGNTSTTNPTTKPQTTPSVAAGTYRVQLNWTAPGTRADGSPLPLSELSGYRVYYLLEGADPTSDSAVPIAGGSTTSLSLNLAEAGTYTFAITAVDQNGLESSLSTPVSIPIN